MKGRTAAAAHRISCQIKMSHPNHQCPNYQLSRCEFKGKTTVDVNDGRERLIVCVK